MNQPNQAVFLVISASKLQNNFLVAFDVFEKGKVLGNIDEVAIKFKPDIVITLEQAAKGISHLQMAYEKAGQVVSLVSLLYVERGNIIEKNCGTIKPYWNPAVRIISTGEKWFMLDDFLRTIGFSVTTNEERYITDID